MKLRIIQFWNIPDVNYIREYGNTGVLYKFKRIHSKMKKKMKGICGIHQNLDIHFVWIREFHKRAEKNLRLNEDGKRKS